jgi:hypothetical protein
VPQSLVVLGEAALVLQAKILLEISAIAYKFQNQIGTFFSYNY